jgi:RNA polymerase sigma factor (sigma-70 family)
MRRPTRAVLRTTEVAVSRTDVPGVADAAVAREPSQALRAAIDRVYPDLCRTIEVLVSRAERGQPRDEIVEIANEVLDEAVARAMAMADKWQQDTSPRPWIARIAAFVILERHRKLKDDRERFPAAVAAPGGEDDVLSTVVDPKTLSPDRVFELLDLVSEPERALLRRAYVDREPQADIARSLGVNDGTLRVQLFRARQRFTDAYRAAEHGEKGGRP